MYYPDENGSPSSSNGSEAADEHEDLFRSKVQALWHEECFVDVTLACDEKIMTAHKLVLSAYSDYFKRIFSSLKNTHQPTVVFMKDVSFDVLQAVLEFMYCGEVNVAEYNLKSFMKTARSLQIKGLSMEGEDIEERESPQKRKRSSQGSSAEGRQMMRSPPVKRTKTQYKEHNYSEEEDEIDDVNDNCWDEDSSSRPNYGKKARNPLQKRPSQPGSSHHRSENGDSYQQRKRHNSFGNSSHSSQQSRSSFKPTSSQATLKGRPSTIPPGNNRPRPRPSPRMKEGLMSDQINSENEETTENNLDDSCQTSSSRSHHTSRTPPVESSKEDEKRVGKKQSKLLPKKRPEEMSTSDEDEAFGEDSNSCYVCDKEYNADETNEKKEKWTKCQKKHCKNYSCEECLPINCEPDSEFYCIDCKNH